MERRLSRLDYYPVIDDFGNVTHVVTYANDFTDRYQAPFPIALPLAPVAEISDCMEAILSAVSSNLSSANQEVLNTALRHQRKFSESIESAFTKHSTPLALDDLRSIPFHPIYAGGMVVCAVSNFADYFDDLSNTVNHSSSPTFTLQIDPDANLFVISDPFFFDLLIRNALEIFVMTANKNIDVYVSNDIDNLTFELCSVLNGSLPEEAQQHLTAVEGLVSRANSSVQFTYPTSMSLMIRTPLWKTPVKFQVHPDYKPQFPTSENHPEHITDGNLRHSTNHAPVNHIPPPVISNQPSSAAPFNTLSTTPLASSGDAQIDKDEEQSEEEYVYVKPYWRFHLIDDPTVRTSKVRKDKKRQ